jgi:hypothetical protein
VLIAFRKLKGDRHLLAITRADGSCESVECETRSYLLHDLLHYAVETEAAIDGGVWGSLARGVTLAVLNDRSGALMSQHASQLSVIEPVVGVLSGAVKGRAAADVLAALRAYTEASAVPLPPWVSEEFVVAVQERMRRLLGRWNATAFGEAMQLEWP